jgi:DNA-binding XRE family transcriptional regulator
MTTEGHTQKDIVEEVGVSSHTVVAVRQDMGDKDIDIGTTNARPQTFLSES